MEESNTRRKGYVLMLGTRDAVHGPFQSLVRESRVSVPLLLDSLSNSLRAQQRLHTERSKILNVWELVAVASDGDPMQEFGRGCSQSSKMEPGDKRCMARGTFRTYQGRALPEMTSSDCHSAALHHHWSHETFCRPQLLCQATPEVLLLESRSNSQVSY